MGTICSENHKATVQDTQKKRRKGKRGTGSKASSESVASDLGDKESAPQDFMVAVRNGNTENAMKLIDTYHDIDFLHLVFKKNGCDALGMAARSEIDKLALFLLEEGANPNFVNKKSGSTALVFAVSHVNYPMAAMLMFYGANSTLQNKSKESAMTIALHVRDKKMIRILSYKPPLDMPAGITKAMTVDDHIDDILGSGTDDDSEHSHHLVAADIISDEDLGTGVEISSFDFDTHSHHGSDLDPRHLPKLSGWLKLAMEGTKEPIAKYWVVVCGSHLLWSKKKKQIDDDREIEQRRRFDDWISLLRISEIKKLGKQSSQFVIFVGAKRKKMVWTAQSKADRDDWEMEIEHHIHHLEEMQGEIGLEKFMSTLKQ